MSSYHFLSKADKQKGQKGYLTYTFINGLGYSFMAETIIYLLAMHFGAGNIQLGYISSAVYLTGLITFFVPVIFPNVKIVNLFFVAWLIRGIVCILYGIAPSLSDKNAVLVIILVYTLYCVLRNTAYPLNPVIQSVITKPSERGHFSSRVIIILYTSMMLSRLASFGGLSLFSGNELTGLFLLIALGIILNTMASFAIKKIPVNETVKPRSLKQALKIFTRYLKNPQQFLFILLYCGGMSLIVLFNFAIPFLTKVVGIHSNMIFIFTMINFLGVVVSSRLVRPFLDRFGSKPLLTLASLIIFFLSFFWILTMDNDFKIIYYIFGFISMFFIGMIRLVLERLMVNFIPEDDRVGFSSSIAVVFSVISLLVGLAGGWLADLSVNFDISFPHEYSLTFGFMGLLALVNFIMSLFLKESGSLTANQFLTVVSNPRNLKTIHNIDMLKRVNDNVRKQTILIELESDTSHLATQEIRNRLQLATMRDKEMTIRSLFSNPRPALEEDLIKEALDRYSWWRQSAIFALGAYPTTKTKSALRKIFKEKYPYMKSVASKSMARIGDLSCHDEVANLLETEGLDARTYINLVIAISLMEKDGHYWKHIFRLASEELSYRFIQSLMIIGSLRQNFQPPIDTLFYELNLSEKGGFDALFEELADLDLSDEDFSLLADGIENKDYYSIVSWCRHRCKGFELLEPYEYLRKSIVSYKKRHISPSMAMAVMYLTMQLELLYKKQLSAVRYTAE
ncbi:MAG: MFS transporter [Spirochaetales bacterium]|nr:MFS transporter [Spirochaetales bacterium]